MDTNNLLEKILSNQDEHLILLKKLEEKQNILEKDFTAFLKEHKKMNQNQLDFIEEQADSIKTFISPKAWFKALTQPKIGVLKQHSPKPYFIPSAYFSNPPLKQTPSISIVTPSFNQGDFIEKTILSIANQHYPAIEHIIQDGGSKDGTLTILKKYDAMLKHWTSEKDEGQSNAINLGFRHATGDILGYLNSDDILLPGSLHYVANYFNEHPEVDVVYGHRLIINEDDKEIGRWVLPHHNSAILNWADYIPQEALFWRRSIWDKVGGKIDESFHFAMDWDLLLRFKEAHAKFVRLPRFLAAFRVHSKQKTSANISDLGAKEMDRLRERCHGRTVTMKEIRKHIKFYLLQQVIYHRLYRLGFLKY